MDITLKICEDKKEWDDLVDKSPHATIFHKWDYLKVMEKYSKVSFFGSKANAKLFPLIGFEGDKIIALFPIFFYPTRIIKYACSPANGAIYLGPLMLETGETAQKKKEFYAYEFQKAIDEFLLKLNINLIRFTTPSNILDCRSFVWNGYNVTPKYSYEIDLSNGTETIWKAFSENLRHKLRKTEKRGFTVEEGSKEDLYTIFAGLKKRYSEQGLEREMEYGYVSDIYDLPGENLKVFTVKKDQKYVSGVATLTYRDKLFIWIGMPRIELTGPSPNDLLFWKIIQWASDKGYRVVENSWANTHRLCNYKSKFNPKVSIYFFCEKQSSLIKLIYSVKNLVKSKR